MWNDAVDLFVTYMGSGIIVGWFVLSLLYLFLKEKDPAKRVLFLYFPVIILLLYFNPLFVKIIYSIIGEEIYYRFLWIIPMSITISYVAVSAWAELKGRIQLLFGAACVLLVMVSGRLIYLNQHFSVADNLYHVPKAVVEICDAIHVEGREVTAAFPIELVQYVRQYDSTICMPYGREVILTQWGKESELLDLISQDEIDMELLAKLSKNSDNGNIMCCNYIILPEDTILIGNPEEYGIVLYDTIEGYNVYHDTTFYIGL